MRRCAFWKWVTRTKSAAPWPRTPTTCCTCPATAARASIELEDEDGAAVAVSAAELVATLRQAGQALPLVFLSSCHGGSPAGEAAGFAQALVQAGVPQVLAMQTRVSDRYAIELAAAFYRELNTPERPLASRALAQARLTLEAARRRKLAQAAPPEYATAALYCAGAEQPLLDRRLDQRPLRRPPVHEVDAQGLPRLKLGESDRSAPANARSAGHPAQHPGRPGPLRRARRCACCRASVASARARSPVASWRG
jgi:hypothetical protein